VSRRRSGAHPPGMRGSSHRRACVRKGDASRAESVFPLWVSPRGPSSGGQSVLETDSTAPTAQAPRGRSTRSSAIQPPHPTLVDRAGNLKHCRMCRAFTARNHWLPRFGFAVYEPCSPGPWYPEVIDE
jgi:hypothetical protein